MKLRYTFSLLLAVSLQIFTASYLQAQIPDKAGFRLVSEGGVPLSYLLSNSVIDMVPFGSDILMGTGNGLSIWIAGLQDWESYDESYGLGHGSVSALGAKNGVVWAATAYSQETSQGFLPAGGGVGFSTDEGLSWTWFQQPVDPDTVTLYDPTTTNIQNVTYDLLVTDSAVWIASFGGGLRKFSFADSAWHVVPPDTLPFSSLDYLNHRAFSVTGDDSILWVGTAAGVNKSTDGGVTWTNYSHNPNNPNTLSGNFVTALGRQVWGIHDVIWAATWPAVGTGEYYGVSKSDDQGQTWQVVLTDTVQTLKTHNFAFSDSVVYAATNLGLYKSIDGGQQWEVFPQIHDFQTGDSLYSQEFFCALVLGDTLWVGTGDGIAKSSNFGNTWTVYRSFLPPDQNGQPSTYAYPNPFSPRLHNVIRFAYSMPKPGKVTVKIFDFAMDEVATVVSGEYHQTGDYSDTWHGFRSDGEEVATGVYFFRVEREGADTVWGKFAVIY
ncbi:MAG: hypothetical protein NTW14_06725 [bacterium]|nr:hypothetical protein [bacterium]